MKASPLFNYLETVPDDVASNEDFLTVFLQGCCGRSWNFLGYGEGNEQKINCVHFFRSKSILHDADNPITTKINHIFAVTIVTRIICIFRADFFPLNRGSIHRPKIFY